MPASLHRKRFQIFGVGQCSLDYVGRIASYPPPDSKCEFDHLVIEGGGPIATALVALSRWGLTCAFAGVTGSDRFGAIIRRSLADEGVDISGVIIRPDETSQFAFIVAEKGTGRRTIFWQRPTGRPLQPDELDRKTLRQSALLHTDGLFPEASLAACQEAEKAGIPVVVDAGSLRDGMVEIAKKSDFFIASEAFGKSFSGSQNPVDACRKILELGPRLAGVTLGDKGYAAADAAGKTITRSAYAAEAVDTTGCGDIFHAGFIYGIIRGWDVEKCLDLGAWSAAKVSARMGGRAGIPSSEELMKNGYV
jgi:sulfofructose kinase